MRQKEYHHPITGDLFSIDAALSTDVLDRINRVVEVHYTCSGHAGHDGTHKIHRIPQVSFYMFDDSTPEEARAFALSLIDGISRSRYCRRFPGPTSISNTVASGRCRSRIREGVEGYGIASGPGGYSQHPGTVVPALLRRQDAAGHPERAGQGRERRQGRPEARVMTGRAPLVDAVAYYSGLAPWAVAGLLAVVLLIMGWILASARR